MLAGDVRPRRPAARVSRVALAEPGLADQPRRRHLHLPRPGRELRDRHVGAAVRRDGGAQRGELRGVQHRVGEERPGAAAVRVRRVEHHALTPAQPQHRVADRAERGRLPLGHAQRPGQFGVAHRPGPRPAGQPERHRQHHVPPAGVLLEGAGPVAEPALGRGQVRHLPGLAVVHPDRGDRLGDLLAVGAHVLDRRRPGPARDAGQAFQPGQPVAHAAGHEAVPVLPGGHGHPGPAQRLRLGPHPRRGHLDHRAGETAVRDHQVAAAAQDEQRLTGVIGRPHRRHQVRLAAGRHELPGRPAEAERGQAGQQHLLPRGCHRLSCPPRRAGTPATGRPAEFRAAGRRRAPG